MEKEIFIFSSSAAIMIMLILIVKMDFVEISRKVICLYFLPQKSWSRWSWSWKLECFETSGKGNILYFLPQQQSWSRSESIQLLNLASRLQHNSILAEETFKKKGLLLIFPQIFRFKRKFYIWDYIFLTINTWFLHQGAQGWQSIQL